LQLASHFLSYRELEAESISLRKTPNHNTIFMSKTSYVREVSPEQAEHFEALLRQQNWVQFTLEPEVLKEVSFGYEDILEPEEPADPRQLEPHAGIDESGKGDYFGPLVIACCYVDEPSAKKLIAAGIQDSKAIKSDKKMAALASEVRKTTGGRYSIVAIGPEAYNRLYGKFGNLNRLLAWGHSRALENLLERVPDCPRALSDQFGRKETVLRALGQRGRKIHLEQRPKAEADVAVAAASILARHEFVTRLAKLGETFGGTLPKGASAAVKERGEQLYAEHGDEGLVKCAKLHFKTTYHVKGLPIPKDR
jgi:ribonuclease HIII